MMILPKFAFARALEVVALCFRAPMISLLCLGEMVPQIEIWIGTIPRVSIRRNGEST